MTKDSDFKALVRERMAKTGESYAAARANLRGDGASGEPPDTTDPQRFRIPTWPMTGLVAQLRPSDDDGEDRYVDVSAEEVVVHMSDDTWCVLPRDAIVDVRRVDGLRLFAGLTGGKRVHILYGGGGSVVGIRLDRTVDLHAAGQVEELRELRIGVDDADGLIAALT